MIKAAYFPTIIYAKDVNLDNRLFERELLAWADKDKGLRRTNMKGCIVKLTCTKYQYLNL